MIAVTDVSSIMDMLVERNYRLCIECDASGAHIYVSSEHDAGPSEFHGPTFLAVLDACARFYGVL